MGSGKTPPLPSTASDGAVVAVPRRFAVAAALCVVVAVVGMIRRGELTDPFTVPGAYLEFLPFLPLLAAAAVVGWTSRGPVAGWPTRLRSWSIAHPSQATAAMLVIVVAASGWATLSAGSLLASRTPVYHDEFSYVFQARTFLRGGLTTEGLPQAPELLDQMHVVSGDRRYSRYFPGTGVWMLPFLAIGAPWIGWHVAHVVAAVFVALAGYEIARGPRSSPMSSCDPHLVGALAGALFGLAPGVVAFSTLLLAHHPTLVGLSLFLWQWTRGWNRLADRSADRSTSQPDDTTPIAPFAIAAAGLTFAMLCRPMTAAGFALPYGVATATQIVRRRDGRLLAAMAAPIAVGLLLLAAYNAGTTGDPLTTAYSEYNARHTPRHVYGFGNATRGDAVVEAMSADDRRRVMTPYDQWATEHDAAAAVSNAERRLGASLQLSLGVLPCLLTVAVLLRSDPVGARVRLPIGLLFASIASLHLVHVPYWFVGIDEWHYVMESSIGWAMLAALATVVVLKAAPRLFSGLWLATLGVAALLNVTSFPGLWVAESTLAMARPAIIRERYDGALAFFATRAATAGRPVVIAVVDDPTTPHYDYVMNGPALDTSLLFVRIRSDEELIRARAIFPDRAIFRFDARQRFDDGDAFWKRIQ